MNQLVKTEQRGEVAVYSGDPFTEFSNAVNPKYIFGTLLKFSKGDWLAGEESRVMKIGTPMVAVMDEMQCGWVRWFGGKPTDQIMVKVVSGQKPPRRAQLGDNDQMLWEQDEKATPKDPWRFTTYLPMVSQEDGEVYTFTTSSNGGLNAIGEISGIYGQHRKRHPDQYPVVHLNLSSYKHQNKAFGLIKTPKFDPGGYVKKADVATVLAAEGLITVDGGAPAPRDETATLDDEIPF